MFDEITGPKLVAAILALVVKRHPCPTCDMLILGRCVVCEREAKGLTNHFGFTVREASAFDTDAGPYNQRTIKHANQVSPSSSFSPGGLS